MWLAACLFLGDVAVRRIALDVDWIKQTVANEWRKLRGQETATASEYMDKLRSRKAEVDEQLDRSRAARRGRSRRRFPCRPSRRPVRSASRSWKGPRRSSARRRRERRRRPGAPASPPASPEAEKQSYTNRLLRAKQRVWEEREKEKEGDQKKP